MHVFREEFRKKSIALVFNFLRDEVLASDESTSDKTSKALRQKPWNS